MRRKAHEMAALWGGRMPHNQAIVPGGVTEVPDSQKMVDFKFRLAELQTFIDTKYIPTVKAVAATYPEYFNIGAGCKNMMSYGVFPLAEGALKDFVHQEKFFPSKVLLGGQLQDLKPELIGEDVKYSWYKDEIDKEPTKAVVAPELSKKNAYSWVKAPRYNGNVMEVGPLARLITAQNKDVLALGDKAYSVLGRHYARAVKCSMIGKAMDEWVMKLEVGQPVCTPHKVPVTAQGMGLTEAARGALGHWNKIEHGKTAVYNAIVPSTWNMSPMDDRNQMGTMEQALVGTPVKDPANPFEIVRVVRSFDPCLACAIHVTTPDKKVVSQFVIGQGGAV
eukprot:TRINITY_DN3190_c0_g1_i1.p3 TRINITY_DN3190_c0_g1~~TRINITY_DN3190_c0_g1_i1.p3  ORF type:complete len:335 (-),score=16.49 TRINITY_DN3190_c0_g1_i1:1161-2165(-)